MTISKASVCLLVVGFLASTVSALNMEVVTVGNSGNEGELSGDSAGGWGVNRVCGAVNYAYRIGKYEVTSGQYTTFLNAVAGVDTYGLYNINMWSDSYGCKIERYAGAGTISNPYQYRVASDYANRPVNYIEWGDAARFANWMHNGQRTGAQDLSTTEDGSYYINGAWSYEALMAVTRKANATWVIPSEDEWYKAAYYDPNKPGGSGYWNYPTRSDEAPGRDLTDISGNNANYYGNPFPIDSDKYYTTVAGEFQNSYSPYGTYDQGGNVWEWNEATLQSGHGIRGSGYDNLNSPDQVRYLQGAYRGIGYGYSPTNVYWNIGFRVVQVPEPASILLLSLGGLALIQRKRR